MEAGYGVVVVALVVVAWAVVLLLTVPAAVAEGQVARVGPAALPGHVDAAERPSPRVGGGVGYVALPHPRSGPDRFLPGGLAVDPNATYTSEPAPVGIADFGVTPSGAAYEYATPMVQATATIDNFTVANGAVGTNMSFQLNVEDVLTSGNSTFVFWVQDVLSIGIRRALEERLSVAGAAVGAGFHHFEQWLLRRSDKIVVITDDFVARMPRRANERVTVSCQVLEFEFAWQLAEAGDGTSIHVTASLPEAQAHWLDRQHEAIEASLRRLAALAEATS